MMQSFKLVLVFVGLLLTSIAGAQTTVDCNPLAEWNTTTAYVTGNQVKYQGQAYQAKWWTQNEVPTENTGVGKPWEVSGTCSAGNKIQRTVAITSVNHGTEGSSINLTSTTSPTGGTVTWVLTNGTGTSTLSGTVLSLTGAGTVNITANVAEDENHYAATVTQIITITGTQTTGQDCSVAGEWDATVVYVAGNQAWQNGTLYQAKWWTQNESPATNSGTTPDKSWLSVGTCTPGTMVPGSWNINGNSNVNNSSFIGTTVNVPLRFKANNTEFMRLHPFGTFQLGGLASAVADGYFKADITGRVAMRPDPGPNQNNVLLLYSNNQSTGTYTEGFRHYTGFSHVVLGGGTEVGVMNTVEYNNTTGITRGKHLLVQNATEGNLGVGVFSSPPPAKLSVNGNTFLTGTLALGTSYVPTGFKVAVDGKIIATEVHVKNRLAWPDYVFSSTYNLMPLGELSNYIQKHHHLPNVPSAEEIDQEGINVGDINTVLLEKVEELTLYLIEQNKIIQKQQEQLNKQSELLNELIHNKK